MKRIIKQSSRVFELFVNVRKSTLRVVEYGPRYVCEGSMYLNSQELDALSNDTDHDILPIIRQVRARYIGRRNPYFSSLGQPLTKWFEV